MFGRGPRSWACKKWPGSKIWRFTSLLSQQLKLLPLPIQSYRSSTEFLAGFSFRYQAHKNGLVCLGPKSRDLPDAETLCRLQSYRSSSKLLADRELDQMGGNIAGAGAVKSFCIGIGLFMFSQKLWILYDWNEERKVRKLYEGLLEKGEVYQDLLRKGLVSVVAEDE